MLGILFWASAAWPQPSVRVQASEAFDAAGRYERETRFREAHDSYESVAQIDPSAPQAPRARSRASWLQARSEGDYEPLRTLVRAERDRQLLSSPQAIQGFERQIDQFPPGLVRVEALLLAAEAWRTGAHQPERANRLLERVLGDPSARSTEKVVALGSLVDAALREGNMPAAGRAVDRWGDSAPAIRDHVHRLRRRGVLAVAAWIACGAVAALGLAAAVRVARRARSWRRAVRALLSPYGIAISIYVAAVGTALAALYEGPESHPFVLLGLGLLIVSSAARAWAQAFGARPWRLAFALLAAVSVLAWAFLVMARSAGMLDGVGL